MSANNWMQEELEADLQALVGMGLLNAQEVGGEICFGLSELGRSVAIADLLLVNVAGAPPPALPPADAAVAMFN